MSKLSCAILSLLFLSGPIALAQTTVSDINPATPGEKQLLEAASQLEQTVPQAKAQAEAALKQAVTQANQIADQVQNELTKAQQPSALPAQSSTPPVQTEAQKPVNSSPAVLPEATQPNESLAKPISLATEEKQQIEQVPIVDVVKKTNPMADLKLAGGLVVLALLLLLWIFWQPRSKVQQQAVSGNKKSNAGQNHTDEERYDEGEYDFLGTEEAIPVKLDLARAYIDMDEPESARAVLESVLTDGDNEQKIEAKALLKELELKL